MAIEQGFSISFGDWVTACCGVLVTAALTHAASCERFPRETQHLRFGGGEWVCLTCSAPMAEPADGGEDAGPVMAHDGACPQLAETAPA
jgi:hypothetical protein